VNGVALICKGGIGEPPALPFVSNAIAAAYQGAGL
jgi:hypothetical protein